MRVKLILICLCFSMLMRPGIPVSAEADVITYYEIGSGEQIYNFSDLLIKYRSNSVTYKRSVLDYKIQALSGEISKENYIDIQSQYLLIKKQIEQLEQVKKELLEYKKELQSRQGSTVSGSAISMNLGIPDNYEEIIKEIDDQIVNIDLQLQQYYSNLSSLGYSLSDAQISKNISYFYTKYQNLLTDESKRKLENDFLKKCYELMIYQEKLDYYKTYHEYLALIKEINSIRHKYGLVTQVELNKDDVNLLNNNKFIAENENLYKTTLNFIKKNTGITDDDIRIRLPINVSKKNYKYEEIVNSFINNYSGYYQIQNYIESYKEYYNTGYISSGTAYRQVEMKVDYYKLQKDELVENIYTYVNNAIHSYEQAYKSREAALKELQIKEKRYDTLTSKFKYKRASRIEVLESLVELKAAKVAYYQSCYDVIMWQDILDNYIVS